MLKTCSTQALNRLAKRQVLDLLYEPDHVTARLASEIHEAGGAGSAESNFYVLAIGCG
jgi:hypothetical protein